ncbi:LCB4 [[Candida] subhashii]|uniref:LCB4 n=1 Tax=[Candida] subhashii TaxID=561895 RepID=A0A8J5Q4F0_9ASCO|nr:LCB4 [[Candida] subhashii]KAG7660366.1 LCB4 [[Candida] subhashii]
MQTKMKSSMSTERLIYSNKGSILASLDETGIQISEQSLWAINAEGTSQSTKSILACCVSQPPSFTHSQPHIPFRNILYAEPVDDDENSTEDEVLLTYIYPTSKDSIKLASLKIQITNPPNYNSTTSLSNVILDKAYTNHIIRPSILVLINPHGGQGKATTIYKSEIYPILKAAKARITYQETKYHGHGIDIARELDISKYDIIACCSGDGIPHEVINGFYQQKDKGVAAFNKIAITQLPCGSGNALSLSTHGSNHAGLATFQMLKAKRTKLDLMAVTQGMDRQQTTKLSFLTQCYGIIADADIGTDHLRWLGPIRFELGLAGNVIIGTKYPCDLFVNFLIRDKDAIPTHVEMHRQRSLEETELPIITEYNLRVSGPSLDQPVPEDWTRISNDVTDNLNILYVGKMPYISNDAQFFPAALPNDGTMDMVITDTKTSFMETTSILLSVEKGTHVHNKNVKHAKILGYRLIPRVKDSKKHYISVDGEEFPFEPLQVEILPGVLTGLLQEGTYVDTCFTR